ncbi:hypothetical protein E2562_037126 [Oryza meyeriana var. granulata]|uniref:DUF659 domain-containing protein n=1 Tax=Oryza meyeriana var. granulata TaxID=110450 RepID=A0A6G1F203_9ORYZ|nr:hypothetical protein E2562_037126 [Oryza meyeriana var. granulata]
MIELLAKKNIVKENKTKEWKRARDEVNLDHSEGEASSEEEGGNSVVVVHSGRVGSTSSSKGGPMERFCKSTPEEVVAAKKGASLSNKKAKNKVTDSFKNHKEQWALTGCSLMTDAWTDKKDSVDCSSVKKDGKFIFDLVDKWIEEIGEKNVVQVVHSKRRNRLLHDRMSDLVFVKFNSRLKHKRENKTRDPIEKQVVDILEDDNNEFITGVALAADDEQEEPEDPQAEGEKDQEQDVAPAEHGKRKRVVRPQIRKRVKKITDINAGKQYVPEIVAASSSDTENDDDHDVDMGRQSASDQSCQSDSENSISG